MAGLRALGALLVLLLLLIGIPAALAVMGNPLGALPDLLAGDVPDSAVIAVLAAIAWVAWAQFALAAAGELLGAARRRPAPRIPGVFSSQQQLARALVLAVFLVGSVGSLITPEQAQAATLAQRVAATQQQTADTLGSPRHVETPGRATTTSGAQHTQQPTTFYTVPPHGDGPGTLWDIAQDKLGDGARWQEIWHLNEGRHQPDGATMTNPSRLRPGWTVLVPTDAPSSTHTPEAARAAGRAVEVTVQAGDTLSGLAADHGEGSWQQAWHASADRAEPDGARFTDPNLLRPGGQLHCPPPMVPPCWQRPLLLHRRPCGHPPMSSQPCRRLPSLNLVTEAWPHLCAHPGRCCRPVRGAPRRRRAYSRPRRPPSSRRAVPVVGVGATP